MIWVDSPHGPGILGVIGQETARYHAFTASWGAVEAPKNCGQVFGLSYDVSLNSNECIRVMLSGRFEWVWLMDDDHVFDSGTLLTLLNTHEDVVVPLYALRKPPYPPCIYDAETEQDRYRHFTWEQLRGKSGKIPIVSAGKGGVLIRRRVVETLQAPWFERTNAGGEDHGFYKKVRQAGIQPYCNLDATLGHITPTTVLVRRDGTGWTPSLDLGNGCLIDVAWVNNENLPDPALP